jgi:hypothetical protein
MDRERRNRWLLASLVILASLLGYRLWPRPAATPPAASNVRGGARPGGNQPPVVAPDVHLESLADARPQPGDTDRNLFRFGQRPLPPPPPATATDGQQGRPSAAAGPPPAPSIAPIALKFIGIVEAPESARRVAILSDARGVYHGREGDIIEGRYRILRIGTDSIEMAYVDGRGRQMIRLSGQ